MVAVSSEQSGFAIVSEIIRREGVLGLWRGTGVTIATLAPSSAVWWLTHEKAKAAAARSVGSGEEDAKVRP